MNLAALQTSLKQWVATLAAIPLAACVMQNEPQSRLNGTIAKLSWVAMTPVGGNDDLRYTTNAEAPSTILASGGHSDIAPQVYLGPALNGSIGTGAISPARCAEVAFSASTDWTGGSVTITGTDPNGATVSESIAVPVDGNATVSGLQLFASITEVDVAAQGGTGGTFTCGLAESATPGMAVFRRLTLQIAFETISQDPTQNGMLLAQRLRGRIHNPTSRALLALANLGLVDIDDAVPADYRWDGRVISRIVVSVRFNHADLDTDATGTTQTIDSVDVTSTLTDVDGTELPPALQWSHHNIP